MKNNDGVRVLIVMLCLMLILIFLLAAAIPVRAAECRIISAAPGETLPPDPERVELLACLIYSEAGGDACSDLCRMMVGDVALTRELDPRFPGTLAEVLTQPGQYGTWGRTGVKWPARASDPLEAAAVERAYDTALRLLEGKHSEIWGLGYIWQAEFPQGRDVIRETGVYFGR